MYRVHSKILHNNGAITNPTILSPYSSSLSVPYVSNYQQQSAPSPISSSGNRISPAILFIIVILAVVFFILGLLHLLVRFLIKQRSSSNSSISQSNRYPDMSDSDTYQRQLQQLFHLHDSGLDQAFIDALPVFFYKEIIGLKEPFDCAVCLCELLEQDKLRLLPMCNHAFHIECIDTWLLSNSTCPLCRGSLYSTGFAFENSVFDFESQQLEEDGVVGVGSVNNKAAESHIVNGKRVFSVRLGKFRSTNSNNNHHQDGVVVERGEGESSSVNLDVRRCYSMGSFQYVVADSDLRVALGPNTGGSMRQLKGRAATNGSSFVDGDVEGKKINIARKGESFSVSKIWQWSRKDKLTGSSDAHFHNSTVNSTLPWMMNKARGT